MCMLKGDSSTTCASQTVMSAGTQDVLKEFVISL